MDNKLEIAKKIAGLVVGFGTSKIVSQIVLNNTTPKRKIDKISIMSASFVLGSMVADASTKYMTRKIDEIAETFSEKTENTEQD